MCRTSLVGDQRGCVISDLQLQPHCLSCQNTPIQHCAEFINAPRDSDPPQYRKEQHRHSSWPLRLGTSVTSPIPLPAACARLSTTGRSRLPGPYTNVRH
ncbi:hypothetical protein DPEC_G00150660 [Dallia pectoralis]|uniref:Uncharacterized protein n=1 Tax=Dallia pectoralis TaxID=75939 RepID=A0ACC2GJ74_DALPE|nr:hypothetical protein DPEC_G00150660 [Dallia pectoralis]